MNQTNNDPLKGQTNHHLKITFLGGLKDVGEKNMAVIEYQDDAIALDCGNNLSIDLPGINYEINDPSYLETIKHKLKAYVITHGHLDHMGGLKYTVPRYPAAIYGSRYTIGVIDKTFDDELAPTYRNFKPELVVADADRHQRFQLGNFSLEFIRVTHSLPDATAICIDTPIGRIIATGDFRLDPEPLDKMPTDIKRLRELGDQGVLLLLSESSYAEVEGRVPTESTLQPSFYELIDQAEGRIFVAAFSSNMNRAQMIINAAVAAGRKVALEGRGMLSYAEIAVRYGSLKVPKGTIITSSQAVNLPAKQLLVMCTGGQGEPNAALQRMSEGQHKYMKLVPSDTVIISSSPIPGNEARYNQISDRLAAIGVRLYRHPTHELDGCGPLHVSGHARREELAEMLQFVRPKFFIPVHAGHMRRSYHRELAIQQGIPGSHVLLPANGDSLYFTPSSVIAGKHQPPRGLLLDQNGEVVSPKAVKDRQQLSETGILMVNLLIDSRSGQLAASPEIISYGCGELSDSQSKALSAELHRAVQQRYQRLDADRFKSEVQAHISRYLSKLAGLKPTVKVSVSGTTGQATKKASPNKSAADNADQQRFQAMRERLLAPK